MKSIVAVLAACVISTSLAANEKSEVYTFCVPVNAFQDPYVTWCDVEDDDKDHPATCECDLGFFGLRVFPLIPIDGPPKKWETE